MTHTTLRDEVLKTDGLGRVKTPPERRAALLAEFARSGVSGKKFAALVGIKYQTFASWRQHARKARAAPPPATGRESAALHLVEAVLERGGLATEARGATPLCVQLPGGARVEVGDARQAALAAELLRALATRGC